MVFQKYMLMLLILTVSLSVCSHLCGSYKGTEISGSNLIYTKANLLTSAEEATVISLYGNLTKLGQYTVSMEYKIYANKHSVCNKNDNTVQMINSHLDIWLCFDSFYMLSCNQLWELVIKCGTFVEIHRPFNQQILYSMSLESVSWIIDQNMQEIINFDLSPLCAGTYHLWLVYYSRMGKFLKGVKTIYVIYPSCDC